MAEERYVQEVRSMQEAVRKKINSIERVELKGKIDWGFTPSFSAKVSGYLEFKVLSYGPDKNKLDSLIKSVIHGAARSYWKEEGGVDITRIKSHKYDSVFSKNGFWGEYHESYTLGVRCDFILNNANPIYAKGKTASSAAPSHSKQASFKIEGANSEVTKKIKGAEAKLLAKGKAKMPNAKEFKVKMRPNLVKASNGTFYGGHLYGTEDGNKWIKCVEVRIREGKEGAAPKPAVARPTSKLEAKQRPLDKRALGTKLLSFMDSKLSGLTYKYKFSSIALSETGGGRMRGEAKVKCTMLRSLLEGIGRAPNKKKSLGIAWTALQTEVGRQIEERLGGQIIDGWKLTTGSVDFGKNPPPRESFTFSVTLKLEAH